MCKKLTFTVLTLAIAYQTWYNYAGAYELGGKYLDTKHMFYAVWSLIPALFLGIHAMRMVFTKKQEKSLHRAKSLWAKIASGFYLAILGYLIYWRVRIHLQIPHLHQLSHQHEWSFENAMSHMIRFWGLINYGLSFILTFSYLKHSHKIRKAAHEQKEKAQAQKEHLVREQRDVPFYHDPGYHAHNMC